jgi:hypothetical protein
MSLINTELFAPRNAIPILLIVAVSGWFLRRFVHPKIEGAE